MKRLEGRTAAITGAGSGIGRATALALAAKGCRVALADVSAAGLAETQALVEPYGASVSTHQVDVADPEAVARFATEVRDVHGGCQILVNNAGVTSAGYFEDESLEDLHWIVDINVWGVVHGCRSFLPLLRQADEGHIVNLASMVALLGLPQNGAYALTKGAVRSFSESLRAELRGSSIGVSTVMPGAIRTNITSAARGGEAARLARMGQSRLAPLVMRPPATVAARIVRAIEHDRARVVVGPDARMLDLVTRVIPGRSGLGRRALGRVAPLQPRP